MRAAFAAILLAAITPLAQAQQPQAKTAQAVANAVRTDVSRNIRDAREFLLQVHGTHSAAELEAVASALAEVAITSTDLRAVRDAVEVLRVAATDTAHTRYPGASRRARAESYPRKLWIAKVEGMRKATYPPV